MRFIRPSFSFTSKSNDTNLVTGLVSFCSAVAQRQNILKRKHNKKVFKNATPTFFNLISLLLRFETMCRWMAPEVIEHSPYNHQADVFSFAIVLWELLTGRVPYADMTPLQAAVGVVQKGLRPPIPANCPPALATLIQECWARKPADRPSFESLKHRMEDITTSWTEVKCILMLPLSPKARPPKEVRSLRLAHT